MKLGKVLFVMYTTPSKLRVLLAHKGLQRARECVKSDVQGRDKEKDGDRDQGIF